MIALTALVPVSALGQASSTVDVGAGNVNYDGTPQLSVYSISPRLTLDRKFTTLMLGATFSRFDGEGWGSRGLAAISLLSPSFGGVRAELAGRGELNANRVITAARQGALGLRVHYSGEHSGVWVGSGAARVWNGAFWQTSNRSEAGFWTSVTRGVGSRVGLTRSTYVSSEASERVLSFYQLELTVGGRQGPVEFESSVGRMLGNAFDGTNTWSANAAFWFTRFVALSVTAGKYAFDPAQRLPGGKYLTMGMRLAPVRFFVRPTVIVPPSSHRRFTATGEGEGTLRTLRYFGRATSKVEVSGSFTDWRPVTMRRVADGLWELTILIQSGTHHFNIRVDEAEWFVPEGTTPVEDDFNGRVGLLVVPR